MRGGRRAVPNRLRRGGTSGAPDAPVFCGFLRVGGRRGRAGLAHGRDGRRRDIVPIGGAGRVGIAGGVLPYRRAVPRKRKTAVRRRLRRRTRRGTDGAVRQRQQPDGRRTPRAGRRGGGRAAHFSGAAGVPPDARRPAQSAGFAGTGYGAYAVPAPPALALPRRGRPLRTAPERRKRLGGNRRGALSGTAAGAVADGAGGRLSGPLGRGGWGNCA